MVHTFHHKEHKGLANPSLLLKEALPMGQIVKSLFLNPAFLLITIATANVMFILTAV